MVCQHLWGTSFCMCLHSSHLLPWCSLIFDISLFFCLIVGSAGMILYVSWFNNSSAFLMYSSLSITTKHTPLSAVRTTLVLSSLKSFMCLLFFPRDVWSGWLDLLLRQLSPLLSVTSASPWARLWHVCSTHCNIIPSGWTVLGILQSLNHGPTAYSCTSVEWVAWHVYDPFGSWFGGYRCSCCWSWIVSTALSCWCSCWIVLNCQYHYDTCICACFHSLSGLPYLYSSVSCIISHIYAFCHSKVLKCLASLIFFTNSIHYAITSWSKILDSSFLHVYLWHSSISIVLFMVLNSFI